ncbi:hypothetical protein CHKEEEPN_2744 [Methylorubrum podarium]|nr:hypothetical protein CHKEEEPN_2744 [Methylorubrum podarium]
MRHAPGELADGLHLLRLPQRLLRHVLLRAVHEDAGDAQRPAGLVALDLPAHGDPAHRSVGAPDPAFQVELAGLDDARERRLGDPAILLQHVIEEGLAIPGAPRALVAEHRIEARRAAVDAGRDVDVPRTHPGRVEGEGEGFVGRFELARPLGHAPLQLLVRQPKLFLRPLPLAQVLPRLVLAAARAQGRQDGAR